MAISLVASAEGGGLSTATTSAIDTTGATLLIIVCTRDVTSSAVAPTDNKGNTWTQLTAQTIADNNALSIWYVNSNTPTVGSGHTFDYSASVEFNELAVFTFSGSVASPFDVQNGATVAGSSTTIQPGSITPSEDNTVVISGASGPFGSNEWSVDGEFNAITMGDYTAWTLGAAYLIQTSAAAANPTWTFPTSIANKISVIASFKASGGGGAAVKDIIQGYIAFAR